MRETPQFRTFQKFGDDLKGVVYYASRESPLSESGESVSGKWALLDYPDGLPDAKDIDLDPGTWIIAFSESEKLATAYKVRPADKERSSEAAAARTTAFLLAECRKELERKNRELEEAHGLMNALEGEFTELLEENVVLKEKIKSLESDNSGDAIDVFVGSLLENLGIPMRQAVGT